MSKIKTKIDELTDARRQLAELKNEVIEKEYLIKNLEHELAELLAWDDMQQAVIYHVRADDYLFKLTKHSDTRYSVKIIE
jgi:predicted component of type VI protein secretion system